MHISFTTVIANVTDKNGYGVAGMNVCSSLQELGHKVTFSDSTAPIEIAFNQPTYDTWSAMGIGNDSQHRILYTPWESTALPRGWVEGFKKADEVWTTSNVVKQWYEDAGVPGPIYVYHHGIEEVWTQRVRRREKEGPLRFLYVGSPAPRKGGQLAYDAFMAAFGNNPDYHLTIKGFGMTEIRHKVNGRIVAEAGAFNENVTTILDQYTTEQMVQLFQSHDVVVYPSYGEGFGLIPFQAMALGTPTICTAAWADYRDLMVPELAIPSRLTDSPWPTMHPGMMYEPDLDALVDSMRWVSKNFEAASAYAYRNSFKLADQYNWLDLTGKAFQKFT